MTSVHSSYRQVPVPPQLSYQQANIFPGSHQPPPTRSYSPYEDDADEIDASVKAMPLTTNRSRPFGSHKSLSESIQSLRSNQQTPLSLPVKKRSQDAPSLPAPMIPKRDQRTPSPKLSEAKNNYHHHHYQNSAQLKTQRRRVNSETSSEDEELEHQRRINEANENSAVCILTKNKTSIFKLYTD